jgi:hypothetical protein
MACPKKSYVRQSIDDCPSKAIETYSKKQTKNPIKKIYVGECSHHDMRNWISFFFKCNISTSIEKTRSFKGMFKSVIVVVFQSIFSLEKY